MLFLTTVIALWIVRGGLELAQLDPRPDALPSGVWFGTGLLVVLSFITERAARQGKAGQLLGHAPMMRAAFGLALVFVLIQAWNWWGLSQAGFGAGSGLYSFGFFVLTGLHAVHVIGGLVFQLSSARLAQSASLESQATEPAQQQEAASQLAFRLRASATYWHFLFITWLVILGTVHGTATENGPAYVGRVFEQIMWAALVGGVLCWLATIRLIWKKDGAVFGLLAIMPLFSVVFGWVRFQEHDNLRVMIAWQVCIAAGVIAWIMSANLL